MHYGERLKTENRSSSVNTVNLFNGMFLHTKFYTLIYALQQLIFFVSGAYGNDVIIVNKDLPIDENYSALAKLSLNHSIRKLT